MKTVKKHTCILASVAAVALLATTSAHAAVILSTDLTGRTLTGANTATSGLSWTTNGLSNPGQLTYSDDNILNQNLATDYFVPNVNVGNGGTWSTAFTTTVTAMPIELTNMTLTVNVFNNTGQAQTQSREARYTVSVVGNTSGTTASGSFDAGGLTANGPFTGVAVLLDSNGDSITIDDSETWTFTISTERITTVGFFTGFQTLEINGTAIPEPSTALLGGLGLLALLRRRR